MVVVGKRRTGSEREVEKSDPVMSLFIERRVCNETPEETHSFAPFEQRLAQANKSQGTFELNHQRDDIVSATGFAI